MLSEEASTRSFSPCPRGLISCPTSPGCCTTLFAITTDSTREGSVTWAGSRVSTVRYFMPAQPLTVSKRARVIRNEDARFIRLIFKKARDEKQWIARLSRQQICLPGCKDTALARHFTYSAWNYFVKRWTEDKLVWIMSSREIV